MKNNQILWFRYALRFALSYSTTFKNKNVLSLDFLQKGIDHIHIIEKLVSADVVSCIGKVNSLGLGDKLHEIAHIFGLEN
jgi:hypothetical protein